jgi:2-hydroxychromene-2-carboxylate isomerase
MGIRLVDKVSVFIDFKSPYSYVAVQPLIDFARVEQVELEWLPYSLQLNRLGGGDQGGQPEVIYPIHKIRYMYLDVRRFANAQGLIIKGPERIFDGAIAGIGMLFAQRHSIFDDYRDTVFERFFKRDLNIDSAQEIAGVIQAVGGNSQDFLSYLDGEGRAQHAAIQAQAAQLGIFGVPTMVYQGELFWGGDRIEFLREQVRVAKSLRSR